MNLTKQIAIARALSGTSSGGSGSTGGGTGGGSVTPSVQPKDVNFYDYDGTLVHAYTVAQAQALTELPAGPEHPGLVFQGWNWSLENVKALTRAMNIGAMYTTDDGTTRLYITLQEGRTSPMLGVGVNGTVTVDWGDGTTPDVLTGTSTSTTVWTPNHAYAAPGDYVIRLTVDGEMAFTGTSGTNEFSCTLRYASVADARNSVYRCALQRVEIGDGVTSINDSAFRLCNSLASVAIPNGVTNIGSDAFTYCYSLASVTIPNGVTNIRYSTFANCYILASVAIPNGVTDIGSSVFANCYTLASVTIPNSVTGSIQDTSFNSCYSLASVTIPDSVYRVRSSFSGCHGMAYYDFTTCTTVKPLGSSSAFKDIPADCEIRVPAALYDEWIAATNWATYADYIKPY